MSNTVTSIFRSSESGSVFASGLLGGPVSGLLGALNNNSLLAYAYAQNPDAAAMPSTSAPLPANSQAGSSATASLATLVEQARSGSASLDEVAHAFVENALKGAELPIPAAKLHDELPGIEDVISPPIRKAIEEHLPLQKAATLARLKELLPLLGTDANKYIKAFEAVEQADKLVETGNTGGLQTLTTKVDAPIKKFLSERLKSMEALETVAAAATTPVQGLPLLAQIPPSGRNQKGAELTLSMMKKLQDQLPPEIGSILGSGAVQQLIRDAVGNDAQRKLETAAIYDRLVRSMIERSLSEHLLDNFRMLIELRPDPDAKTLSSRMFSGTHASNPEVMYFAVARMDELRQANQLGMGRKLRLIFSGYYGAFLPILVVVMAVLFAAGAAVFVYLVFQFRKKESVVAADEQEFQREHNETISKLKGFHGGQRPAKNQSKPSSSAGKSGRGYVNPLQGEDEYSRLLSFFGLDDSATETEIKRSYRDKVKNFHPDSAGKDATTTEAERTGFFIEAKETYDRILEIRGSWFGSKPK